MHLPSCGPRFESKARHHCLFQFMLKLWFVKDENKHTEASIGPCLNITHPLMLNLPQKRGTNRREKAMGREQCDQMSK